MPVMCYICGREFGSASISIHIPNCEKKWDVQQQKLPKKQRRPPPARPMDFDRVINGDLKGPALQQAMEEYNSQAFDDFNKKALDECKNCGRTFLPRALEVHLRSCKPGQEKTSAKPANRRQSRSPTKLTGIRNSKSPVPPSSSSSSSSLINNTFENSFNNRQVRPGTYKKSPTTVPYGGENDEDPTREDIIAMVEKDVAFSTVENRRVLMNFIRKISHAH